MSIRKDFRDVIESAGACEIRDHVTTRRMAATVYAPRRKTITSTKTVYQVLVDGVAVEGPGFSTEAWRTKKDAVTASGKKTEYLAKVWGKDAPKVEVKGTKSVVATLKEWVEEEKGIYRIYRWTDGGYVYTGVSR